MTKRSFDILSQRSYRGRCIQPEGTSHRLTATKTGDIITRLQLAWALGFDFMQSWAAMCDRGFIARLFGTCPACATHIWGDMDTLGIYLLMIQTRGMPVGDGPEIHASSF